MNGLLNNPYLTLGMGLLSGNQGVTKGAAFSNAMGGGLLGLREARRAQELQSIQQQRALQQQAVMQSMAAQRARQEREAKQRAAMGVPGEQWGPPDPSGGMWNQPGTGMYSTDPREQQQAMIEMARNSADPVAALQQMNKPGPAPSLKQVMGPNGPMWVEAKDAIGKPAYAAPLVQVGQGDVGMPVLLTPEEKRTFGYREDETPYKTPKGDIKLPPRDPGEKYKMKSFVENMRTSLSGIKNRFLDKNGNLKADIDYSGLKGSFNAIQLGAASGQGVMASIAQSTMSPGDKKLVADYLEFIAGSRGYSSGAAVPEIEVARDMSIYAPQPTDTGDVIAYRIKKMEDRLDNVSGIKDPKRRREVSEKIAAADEIEINKMAKKHGQWIDGKDGFEYKDLGNGTFEKRAK